MLKINPQTPPPKKTKTNTAYIYSTNKTFLDAGKNQLEVAR